MHQKIIKHLTYTDEIGIWYRTMYGYRSDWVPQSFFLATKASIIKALQNKIKQIKQ